MQLAQKPENILHPTSPAPLLFSKSYDKMISFPNDTTSSRPGALERKTDQLPIVGLENFCLRIPCKEALRFKTILKLTQRQLRLVVKLPKTKKSRNVYFRSLL